MGKRLFLIMCLSLFVNVISSSFLMATDEVAVTRMDDRLAVETVIPEPEPEPEPEPVVQAQTNVQIQKPVEQMKPPVAGAAKTAPQMVNYTVGIYSDQMVVHNLSYSSLYKTGKLIYGHNSANLLGNLGNLNEGSLFTVTEGGSVVTYRVSSKVMYQKTSDGYLNSDPYLMGKIMKTAMGHNLAIMTCAGQSYGNGDASHRLVVYADPV